MPITQEEAAKLKATMESQLGKPYLWGAKPLRTDQNPAAFDCSGYVKWCWSQLGIVVPEGSEGQLEASVHVDAAQVGDLAFFKHANSSVTHHVGMLYDPTTVIEARGEPYEKVITRPRAIWEAWHEFLGWYRFKAVA